MLTLALSLLSLLWPAEPTSWIPYEYKEAELSPPCEIGEITLEVWETAHPVDLLIRNRILDVLHPDEVTDFLGAWESDEDGCYFVEPGAVPCRIKFYCATVVSFDEAVSSDEVVEEFLKFHLLPASANQLLALEDSYVLEQGDVMVALGEMSNRRLPRVLTMSGSEYDLRNLEPRPWDTVWPKHTKFLAIFDNL